MGAKINGVLIGVEGKQAVVLLEHGQEFVRYYLPWKILKSAGIQLVNQPFEITLGEEIVLVPLAGEKDIVLDRVELDRERKGKLKTLISGSLKVSNSAMSREKGAS